MRFALLPTSVTHDYRLFISPCCDRPIGTSLVQSCLASTCNHQWMRSCAQAMLSEHCIATRRKSEPCSPAVSKQYPNCSDIVVANECLNVVLVLKKPITAIFSVCSVSQQPSQRSSLIPSDCPGVLMSSNDCRVSASRDDMRQQRSSQWQKASWWQASQAAATCC